MKTAFLPVFSCCVLFGATVARADPWLVAGDEGVRGDIQLLAVKSLLDGIAAIAFAAALGAGVYLSALTVLVV